MIKTKKNFATNIELIIKKIIPIKKANGKRMKKIRLSSGKN
ncbi:unnamed protein product, partial [marine sediment metagenome]